MNPLTTEEIIQGLLKLAMKSEWTLHWKRCGRGCCDESYMGCEHCGAQEDDGHKEGCFFVAITKAAQEYVDPPISSAQTLWDRIANATPDC